MIIGSLQATLPSMTASLISPLILVTLPLVVAYVVWSLSSMSTQFKMLLPPPRCQWHTLVLSRIYPDVWICPSDSEHPPVDVHSTQRMPTTEFQDQPGALLSLYKEQLRKRESAQLHDPTSTEILPHANAETLRLAIQGPLHTSTPPGAEAFHRNSVHAMWYQWSRKKRHFRTRSLKHPATL
jgi:hypothetical protein